MIPIPAIDQNDYLIEAALEGITYFLRLSWNSEALMWVMSIENANNQTILAGAPLMPNTPLIGLFRHLTLPPGEFIALSQDPMRDKPGRMCFVEGRCTLYYITEAQYAAL